MKLPSNVLGGGSPVHAQHWVGLELLGQHGGQSQHGQREKDSEPHSGRILSSLNVV